MPDVSTGEMPVESLAEAVDKAAAGVAALDDQSRAAAGDLRAAVEAVHRAGLVTIVRRLRDDPAGRELLYELVDDPLIRMLFSLHGIIRTDTPPGIGAAGEHTGKDKDKSGEACGCGGGGCGCGSGHAHGGHSDEVPQQAGPTLIPLSAIGLRLGGLA